MLYEDGDFINPFRSFAKTVVLREFKPFASFSEIFELYVPPAPQKFHIDFAIDASWPDNCEEPYDLETFGYEGSIYPDDPDLDGIDQGEGIVYVEAFDWQGNVSIVSCDTTPITGGVTELYYNPVNERYEGTITDALDAPPGDYVCLLAAYSEDDLTLGLFNYITVIVDDTPPPAVQTIWGHVGDSFFLDDLNGSTISVVNQDPLGYVPELGVVVDGMYSINVTTGLFNMSIAAVDGIHMSHVYWDIAVTTDEDVRIDAGLFWPNQPDPYDPFGDYVNYGAVTSFSGRIVDSMGFPVVGATIELSSPDSWGMTFENQYFVQAEVTDDGGYFSMLNVPVEAMFGSLINTFEMVIRAEGYEVYNVGYIPATSEQTWYEVIQLTEKPLELPVWEEDFELDTGWMFSGYYHRQLYDPGIKNISFNPSYSFLVIPPDEGDLEGSLPPPVNGEYYLWYGVEADGNFLGTWDPGQGPYTGGISMMAHSGAATSPEIDLMPYATARIEFDMCYDIESNIPSGFEEQRLWIDIGGMDNLIKFFNTFVDPGPIPYPVSMRGYFRTPIWCHYEFDLTPYVGNIIRLDLTLSTDDSLYNGARGQFIDNIKIYAQ